MKGALAGMLCALGLWYLLVAPTRTDVEALQGRLARADAEVRLAQAVGAASTALTQEIQRLERSRSSFESASAASLDPNAVLAELESIATESQVRISSARPRTQEIQRSIPGVSFELGVEGRFHDMGRFLTEVASARRVMSTTDVILKARTGREGTATVNGSIVVVAFDLSQIPETEEQVAYDHGGARDPFVSTEAVAPTPATWPSGRRNRGLGAALLADIVVRGIARHGDRMVAILETTDRQSFLVRESDRLADGVVHDIETSGVVFAQRDAHGGLVRVQKTLRSSKAETE